MIVKTIRVTVGKTVQRRPFEPHKAEITAEAELEDGEDETAALEALRYAVTLQVQEQIESMLEDAE